MKVDSVETFLVSIHARLDSLSKAKKAYEKPLSPDFNPLVVTGLNENRMSSVIAFLLNPKASHGQGDVFLRAFIKQMNLGWNMEELRDVRVRTEAPTNQIEVSNRRIDILVEGMDFAFVIENKFWAVDQDKQLEHYEEHLLKLKSKNSCLIYLTPDRTEPSAGSMSRNQFEQLLQNNRLRLISYKEDMLIWLNECQTFAKAPNVWSFLTDLSRYIETTFKGVTDVDSEEIVKAALKSSDTVEAAMKIAFASDDLKLALLNKLRSELDVACAKKGWKLSDHMTKQQYSGLTLDMGPYPCIFA